MYYNITGITARLDSGQGRHPRLERRGQPSPHHPFTPVALTEARGSNASRSVHQPAHRRSSGPPVIPPAADNHNSQTRLRRSDESESITATTASGTGSGPATGTGNNHYNHHHHEHIPLINPIATTTLPSNLRAGMPARSSLSSLHGGERTDHAWDIS